MVQGDSFLKGTSSFTGGKIEPRTVSAFKAAKAPVGRGAEGEGRT